MKKPLIHTQESNIIAELQYQPLTVTQLSPMIPIHIQSLRTLLKQMENEGIIERRGFTKGSVRYAIKPEYRRRMPRIKRWHAALEHYVYSGLDAFLGIIGTETNAMKAARFLPELCTKLLMVGFRYNAMIEEAKAMGIELTPETIAERAKPMLKDLRSIKVELQGARSSLEALLFLYEQIANHPDFWDPVGLAGHYNHQVDDTGMPIPPVDMHSVVNAHNLIQE